MKAKEWIESFKIDPQQSLKNYCEETAKLVQQRGGHDSAAESAVREQINKFRSIQKEISELQVADFESEMELVHNKIWSQYCRLSGANHKRNVVRQSRNKLVQDLLVARQETDDDLRIVKTTLAHLEHGDRLTEAV